MVNKQSRTKDILRLILSLLALILINYFGTFFFKRFDLTEERRFTLSEQTVNTLDSLTEEVIVKVYLEGDDLNAGFLRLQKEIREMLDEFEAYSSNNLSYEFVNPYSLNKDPDKVIEQLSRRGIQPTNLTVNTESGLKQQYIFPAATIYYKGKSLNVQLLKTECKPAHASII